MESASLRRNRQVRYTPRASPRASNPGPRLALEAGTRRVNHRWESVGIFARPQTQTPRFSSRRAAARRLVEPAGLADLQDVLLLRLGRRVDLVHVRVRQLLDLVVRLLVVVFGDLLVLGQLLHRLVAVAADVAHGHAMVLGHAVQFLDELLAPLFGERRYRQADDLAVVARVQPQIAGADHLLDQSDLGYVPWLDGDQVRFRDVQVGNLIEWRGRTVVVHPKVVQNA